MSCGGGFVKFSLRRKLFAEKELAVMNLSCWYMGVSQEKRAFFCLFYGFFQKNDYFSEKMQKTS